MKTVSNHELTRLLSIALLPEGNGLDPTDLEIILPNCGDGRVQVKITAYLEPVLLERMCQILSSGLEALKPVNTTAPVPEEGFPMSSIPKTDFHKLKHVQLLMGGEWVRGGWNTSGKIGLFTSEYTPKHTWQWDEQNQPTAWKPIP